MKKQPTPHYPVDIKLDNHPLAEAWLEIRWELKQEGEVQKDPAFPYALGVFYEEIRSEYPHKTDLPASAAPVDLVPHIVRHQFRPSEGAWPALQLGPGVATVNYTTPYSWSQFKEGTLYLRSKLERAYQDSNLRIQSIALQYRNVIPFEYSSNNLSEFLKQHLNVSINFPPYVPGNFGIAPSPSSMLVNLSFELNEPKGQGTVALSTAAKKMQPTIGKEVNEEIIVLDLRITSTGSDIANVINEKRFGTWLNAAHAVVHEWFFSLVDGDLMKQYEGREK